MKRSAAAVIFAAATYLATAAAHGSVIVTLRPTASVSASLVTLGDVAEIRATDPIDAERLAAILVSPAPPTGRDDRLSYVAVRERLLAAGIDLAQVEFAGAVETVVTFAPESEKSTRPSPTPARAEAHDVKRAVEEAIVRKLARVTDVTAFTVEAELSEAQTAFLSAAAVRGCDVVGGSPPWRGEQTFVLRVLDGAERLREVRVTCQLRQHPLVLAAKHALPRGHVVQPGDLAWKRVGKDEELGAATNPRQLIGRETRQPIRTGQPIPPDAVRSLPLVRSGQFVTVTSQRPGVSVQRTMKATTDGAHGDVIPLVTLEDRKTVLAKVTGLHEAETVGEGATAGAAPQTVALSAQIENSTDNPPLHREPRGADGPVLPVLHEERDTPRQIPDPFGDRPRVLANPIHPQCVSE